MRLSTVAFGFGFFPLPVPCRYQQPKFFGSEFAISDHIINLSDASNFFSSD
jgi:hypothetical protein